MKDAIDAIVVDLPYYGVVKDEFDNQWLTEKEYLKWVEDIFTVASKLIKDNGNIIVFCSRQYARHICNIFDDKMNWTEKRQIIWVRKRGFNNTRGTAFASGYEPILYWCNGDKGTFNNVKIKPDTKRPEYTTGMLKDGVSLSDVWTDIPALPHNSKEKVAHPTQKPIKLMERIIEVFTNEGDTVLDFCMGSGSTGVACKNLNRNFIGIEKDKNYFDIAKTRIEN
jgi:DNA modification methylase